jgi:hypothetical protein
MSNIRNKSQLKVTTNPILFDLPDEIAIGVTRVIVRWAFLESLLRTIYLQPTP